MKTQLPTPVIEHLDRHAAEKRIYVGMTLAGVPVTIEGRYVIDTDVFYPLNVEYYTTTAIPGGISGSSESSSLESYCEAMGWDFDETYRTIQEAVERTK